MTAPKDMNEYMLELQCLLYLLMLKHTSVEDTLTSYGEAVRLSQALKRDSEIKPGVPTLWKLSGEMVFSNTLIDGAGVTIHVDRIPVTA